VYNKPQQIPVVDLMQISHPGYRAYSLGQNMDDIMFPAFLDYSMHVCNRFKHYAYEHGKSQIKESSLSQIVDLVHELNETDDPNEVFPIRHALEGLCHDFKQHCAGMGRCFKSPDNMSDFYNKLGELVEHMTFKFAGVMKE
tara:strand:+ start:195 stop:617 length:423 start_codon:yes stop_codon:yes gene_type:complete